MMQARYDKTVIRTDLKKQRVGKLLEIRPSKLFKHDRIPLRIRPYLLYSFIDTIKEPIAKGRALSARTTRQLP